MKQYKIILLDVDGTLLDFDKAEEQGIGFLLRTYGVLETEENKEAYHKLNQSYWRRMERGELTRDQVLCLRFEEFFGSDTFKFYNGVSYRHCLVWHKGTTDLGNMTPPHDISGKVIGPHLSDSPNAVQLIEMMKKSYDLLKDHPVNKKRKSEGKRPANSIWLWGEGTKPALENFTAKTGLKGGVISAVDLVKGIGVLAGLKVINVEGATGNWDTNFAGKAAAAADALLGGLDFVYVHMEAPDECGHHGDTDKKIYSIEQVDMVAKTVSERLRAAGEPFCMLICPDHPTPIALKTHTADPVPFLLYRSNEETGNGAARYDEEAAMATGLCIPRACELMKAFLR